MSETPEQEPVKEAAKTAGRGLFWLAIIVVIVVLVIGVFLLGPLGLIIVVPALLLIWGVAAVTAGGPAAGA